MTVRSSPGGDGVWVIYAGGRLDASGMPGVEAAFRAAVLAEPRAVVVDLSEATYISSSGLKAIVSTWRLLRARGRLLVLCGLSPRLREIFDMVGFSQILDSYESLAAAQAALTVSPGFEDRPPDAADRETGAAGPAALS